MEGALHPKGSQGAAAVVVEEGSRRAAAEVAPQGRLAETPPKAPVHWSSLQVLVVVVVAEVDTHHIGQVEVAAAALVPQRD